VDALTSDYDLAMPVDAAPASPVTAMPGSPTSTQYFIAEDANVNSNNNNSNESAPFVRPASQPEVVEEEGYLAPAVSIKKQKPLAHITLSNASKSGFSQAVPPSKGSKRPTVKPHGGSVQKSGKPSAPSAEPEAYLDPSPVLKSGTDRSVNDYTKSPGKARQADVTIDIEKNDGSTDFFGARNRLKQVSTKRPSAKHNSKNEDNSYLEVF